MIPYESTVENADRCARGELVIYRMGQRASRKLNKRELAEYEASKVRHYAIETSRGEGEVSRAYWRWCKAIPFPFIAVRKSRKYARVRMDWVTMPHPHRPHREALHEIRLLFQMESGSLRNVYTGVYNACGKIPVERGEMVAAALVRIASAARLV